MGKVEDRSSGGRCCFGVPCLNGKDAGHTQKGTPYGVRVHVLMGSVGGKKENRMERASFELGALF